MEEFTIHGTKTVLNLAKNPAGFNQNISAVMQDETLKDVVIVINDNAQDGTDVSWLWDVDFDRFKGANVNSITVSGIRCYDMGLRLKYVDIASLCVSRMLKEQYANGLKMAVKTFMCLLTIRHFYSTRDTLKRLEGAK